MCSKIKTASASVRTPISTSSVTALRNRFTSTTSTTKRPEVWLWLRSLVSIFALRDQG